MPGKATEVQRSEVTCLRSACPCSICLISNPWVSRGPVPCSEASGWTSSFSCLWRAFKKIPRGILLGKKAKNRKRSWVSGKSFKESSELGWPLPALTKTTSGCLTPLQGDRTLDQAAWALARSSFHQAW